MGEIKIDIYKVQENKEPTIHDLMEQIRIQDIQLQTFADELISLKRRVKSLGNSCEPEYYDDEDYSTMRMFKVSNRFAADNFVKNIRKLMFPGRYVTVADLLVLSGRDYIPEANDYGWSYHDLNKPNGIMTIAREDGTVFVRLGEPEEI